MLQNYTDMITWTAVNATQLIMGSHMFEYLDKQGWAQVPIL